MNEIDYKNLLTTYQQKTNDLLIHNIALESKILTANQIIDALNKKVIELSEENEKLKASKSKKTSVGKTDTWEE